MNHKLLKSLNSIFGRALNHYGYAFLSYWRVLELAFPKSKARVAWMETVLPSLKGRGVPEALTSVGLEDAGEVCRHLFESGRCAMAHATGKPIINPDDPRDAQRLYRELPLVREFAIQIIEERFGILTSSTEYAQHLYELRGWKNVFGADLIGRLLNGNVPREDEQVDMPYISVRLRERPPYLPMERMTVSTLDVERATVNVTYASEDGLFEIRFQLDFAEERLQFAIDNGIFGYDDGSVAAAEHKMEIQRFVRDYLLNGELQILDADTGRLLSRKDAFIPLNCFADLDGCNANIACAQGEVDRRRAAAL